MKRAGGLFDRIVSWENLELAARKARKRKRSRIYTEDFELQRESVLSEIRTELLDGCWQPGRYREFRIYDPKERVISAAPYRDRIVHHGVCNIVGPVLERSFIAHTYSCRTGLGTGAAREQCKRLARTYRYALKIDVCKYFASIDHILLKRKIRRLVKCRRTLDVLDRIIDSWSATNEAPAWFPGDDLLSPLVRPRGVPIGSLTSQLFANLYLSKLDHFIQEKVRPRGYLRYTDDMLLFSHSKAFLRSAQACIREELQSERLNMHERKSRVVRCDDGVPFLGFRFFPERVRLLRANRIRFEKRMRAMRKRIAVDRAAFARVWPSMFGWMQFVREQPGTEGLIIAECRSHVF